VKGLSYAQGDLEKTIGGYANATRRLAGEWENLKAKMGGPVAGFGADALASIRQVAHDPIGYMKALVDPEASKKYQREADKRAGVNSKEMTAPIPMDTRSRNQKIMDGIFERRQARDKEVFIDQPARQKLSDMAQAGEGLKNALGNAIQGPLGNVLGGFLKGGLAGAVKGAAQGGLLNQLVPQQGTGPLSSHIIGGADFAKFAQEQTSSGQNAQLEAQKEAAKNTKETVGQLKDVVSGIKDLATKFAGTKARLSGPS
jgi:hypothetical protein